MNGETEKREKEYPNCHWAAKKKRIVSLRSEAITDANSEKKNSKKSQNGKKQLKTIDEAVNNDRIAYKRLHLKIVALHRNITELMDLKISTVNQPTNQKNQIRCQKHWLKNGDQTLPAYYSVVMNRAQLNAIDLSF